MNEAVAFYQVHPGLQAPGVALATRKDRLEAFAQAHNLRVIESFSGPAGGDAFTRAVSLSRRLGGLLLVTSDASDERDIRLMLNLTQLGVHFVAVQVEKVRPRPWPDERH